MRAGGLMRCAEPPQGFQASKLGLRLESQAACTQWAKGRWRETFLGGRFMASHHLTGTPSLWGCTASLEGDPGEELCMRKALAEGWGGRGLSCSPRSPGRGREGST